MKNQKLLLYALLSFSVLLPVFGQNAEDFQYTVEAGNITITAYAGTVSAVVIPEEINGLPVAVIGKEGFSKTEIVSLVIPESVKIIGDAAFYDCKKLASVTLPGGLTDIGYRAFEDCASLAAIG
jgi:hypothetical protein